MNTTCIKEYINNNVDMLQELYDLFYRYGNIYVIAYFRKIKKIKNYYDFQLINEKTLKGSYDKLEILELIYYLENK